MDDIKPIVLVLDVAPIGEPTTPDATARTERRWLWLAAIVRTPI